MGSASRAGLLCGFMMLAATPLSAQQDMREFTAGDGSYSFRYPGSFGIDTEFADGTGDPVGVKASSPENGDVLINFYSRPATGVTEVTQATAQALADQYVKANAVVPSVRYKSHKMTTMLGQPAVDILMEQRGAIKRFVATVLDGREYNFYCVYRADKAGQFAPACDQAVATVALLDPRAPAGSAEPEEANAEEDGDAAATSDGICSLKAFRGKELAVTEAASKAMMKDQSPEAVARVVKAHQEANAIGERITANGNKPIEKDCTDIEAILATLE